MTNDLTPRSDAHVQPYDQDPFLSFANESGPGIQGKLLACRKGEWALGPDGASVPPATQFLMIVPETMRGWLKWENSTVVAADMGFVRDNFRVKHRNALGDLDEALWEKDPKGEPRDPWSPAYRTLLIEVSPPHGDVTFSSSAYGAEIALKAICADYSAGAAQHPGAYPVVTLTTKTRPSKSYGPIVGPWFNVVGWASPEDVRAGRKAASRKRVAKAPKTDAPNTAPDYSAELNDEVPADWGSAAA